MSDTVLTQKRLIVNADDFGFTGSISRGILEAHHNGIVTSTSVMIGVAGAPDQLAAAIISAPQLGFGLHFTLTGGVTPVSDPHTIPTLLSDNGTFPELEAWQRHTDLFNPEEIEREIRAQFDLFVRAAGRLPDHLDSHHNSLPSLPEKGLPILLTLAADHNLPLRIVGDLPTTLPDTLRTVHYRMPDHFADGFYDKTATLGDLLLILTNLGEGSTELMCHPGYMDDPLADSYRKPRENELAALTHKSVREVLQSEGIRLINFGDLEMEK